MSKKPGNTKTETPETDTPETATPTLAAISVVVFKITSLSPLLMNNAASAILKPTINAKNKQDAELEAKTYRNQDGELQFPAEAFKRSLVAGSLNKKIGRTGLKRLLAMGVNTIEDFVTLEHPTTGTPLTTYTCDERTARTQEGKLIQTKRPRIEKWAARVAIEVDGAFVTINHVLDAWNLAGRIVGVGNFRPEKNGKFGRYTVAVCE